MIKRIARPNKPSSSPSGASTGTAASTQPLPHIQTEQNVQDPATQLNSHTGSGATASLNPNDPNIVSVHSFLTKEPWMSKAVKADKGVNLNSEGPNNDELARISTADERVAVKPASDGTSYRAESTAARDSTANTGTAE